MKLYLRKKVWLTGLILMALMLKASHWQWQRHQSKIKLIETLNARLELPVTPLEQLLESLPQDELVHRRVLVEGLYDFSHEVVVRNKRLADTAGVHVLTPLQLRSGKGHILVNRGFLPIEVAKPGQRQQFARPESTSFIGLVKASQPRKFLSPRDDPAGDDHPWVDSWQRVNIAELSKQLPFPVLPVYVELIPASAPEDGKKLIEQIVHTDAGKEDMLFLPLRGQHLKGGDGISAQDLPVPVFSTYIPPGRHLGYVFEWAIMAVITFLICIVLQLRPPKASLPQAP